MQAGTKGVSRIVALVLAGGFLVSFAGGASQLLSIGLLAALVAFLWATLAIPAELTAILFFTVLLLTGLAPDHVALAGFESKAVWLVFAGLVLSEAISRHDMGHALFDRLLRGLSSYRALVWLVAAAGLLMAFLVPSAMGRVLLLSPLVAALADRLALDETLATGSSWWRCWARFCRLFPSSPPTCPTWSSWARRKRSTGAA